MNKKKVQELFSIFSEQCDITPFNAMLESSISLVGGKLKDPLYEDKDEVCHYAAAIANFVFQTMTVAEDREELYKNAKLLKDYYEELCKPFFLDKEGEV